MRQSAARSCAAYPQRNVKKLRNTTRCLRRLCTSTFLKKRKRKRKRRPQIIRAATGWSRTLKHSESEANGRKNDLGNEHRSWPRQIPDCLTEGLPNSAYETSLN